MHISLYYEILRSQHIHKSMLLRGVKFGAAALDRTDIQSTKGRASQSGRSYSGGSMKANLGSSRGRGIAHNGESRPNPFAPHIDLSSVSPAAFARLQSYHPPPAAGAQMSSSFNSESFRQGPPPQTPFWGQAHISSTRSRGYMPPGQTYVQEQRPLNRGPYKYNHPK